MPFENITLGNPYSRPPVNTLTGTTGFQLGKPITKPLYSPTTQPIKAGDVTVTTNKPVLVEPIKGDYKPLPIEEKSFWKRITKTQKGLIIGGAIAIVVAAVFLTKKK